LPLVGRYLVCAADRPMQLNQGWFLCNGHCGYVLQPEYFKQASYSPFDKHTLVNVDPITIGVTVCHSCHQLVNWFTILSGWAAATQPWGIGSAVCKFVTQPIWYECD